jgi:hypothetical protein
LLGERVPAAEPLIDPVRVGLGDVATHEREGGDGVGTDEPVRDGWPRYREPLGHGNALCPVTWDPHLATLLDRNALDRNALDGDGEHSRAGNLPRRRQVIVGRVRLAAVGCSVRPRGLPSFDQFGELVDRFPRRYDLGRQRGDVDAPG